MRRQATGILAAARRGDEHALGLLWREINPALIRYLRVRAAGDAEELAAATWVVLSRDLVNFGGDDHAWRVHAFIVARRQLVAWRRGKARKEPSVAETIRRHVTRPSTTVDAAVTDVAIDVLASLPDEQAEALVLRTAAHLPVRDVARVMKLSEAKAAAAIHAGAAGAAAVASSTRHRREVDGGRPTRVVHPEDGPAHIAGLTGDDAVVESLLAGRPVGLGAPPSLRLVADVLAALAAPPLDNELSGAGPALASFRAQFAPSAVRRARHHRLVAGPAGWLVAASVVVGATLVGAYTAVLPGPLQRFAHYLIHAPAPTPDPRKSDKSPVGPLSPTGATIGRSSATGSTTSSTPGTQGPPGRTGASATGRAGPHPSATGAHSTHTPPGGPGSRGPSGSGTGPNPRPPSTRHSPAPSHASRPSLPARPTHSPRPSHPATPTGPTIRPTASRHAPAGGISPS